MCGVCHGRTWADPDDGHPVWAFSVDELVRQERSRTSRGKQDECCTEQTEHSAAHVPRIRPLLFDKPKPEERGRDVDAAIGRIGTPREIRWGKGQQPRKNGKADEAWQQPERARPLPHPGPDGETAKDLGQGRSGVNGECGRGGHDDTSLSGWR